MQPTRFTCEFDFNIADQVENFESEVGTGLLAVLTGMKSAESLRREREIYEAPAREASQALPHARGVAIVSEVGGAWRSPGLDLQMTKLIQRIAAARTARFRAVANPTSRASSGCGSVAVGALFNRSKMADQMCQDMNC